MRRGDGPFARPRRRRHIGCVKISFVIPYFYPAWQYGGQPRAAFNLARALAQHGHHIKVLTTDSGGAKRLDDIGSPKGERTIDGVNVIYYRNISNHLAYRHRLFWPPLFFKEIRSRLRASEVVHIHELRSFLSVSAARAAEDLGIPYLVSPHGGLRHLGKAAAKSVFDRLWGKRIAREAAAVMAVSSIEETDAAWFGIPPDRVRRLPNAVDSECFRNLPDQSAFRKRWNLGTGKVVLFLGRLHWIKGADLLLDAFQAIRSSMPDLQLVIAGPDDGQGAELRRRAEAPEVHRSVRFIGHLGQIEKLEALTGSDVTVVPSRSEVFALTAVESLMCCTPVLLSSVCGLEPLPGMDAGGMTFENGDARDLARKLLIAIDNNDFRKSARNGRDFVRQHFSSDAVAAKAERIYEGVISSPS
jgi:glycosyltransferase involved in cell wall biosynthesis